MGKVLILPRRGVTLEGPAPVERPVPDFTARLRWWRARWLERREDFRRDIHAICEGHVERALNDRYGGKGA